MYMYIFCCNLQLKFTTIWDINTLRMLIIIYLVFYLQFMYLYIVQVHVYIIIPFGVYF